MNQEKVQNWSGYQQFYQSGNKYIISGSNTNKCISITASG